MDQVRQMEKVYVRDARTHGDAGGLSA